MNKDRITIQIATRDRHSEVGFLLQSLRTQSFQAFDIMIADESQTPIQNCYFLNMLFARLQQEGHKIKLIRNDVPKGVCGIRNLLIESNDFDNEYSARFDDDVILEPDYLISMVRGLKMGYDLMSGVTPNMPTAEWERQPEILGNMINKLSLDKDGKIIEYTDDCGYSYETKNQYILPATNFRSNAVYKAKLEQDGIRYPDNLSPVGFREELWFSLKAILKGYKLGVDISAKAYHFQTPSGGCRFPDYPQKVQQDQATTEKWIKLMFDDYGDFISAYKKKVTK
jgi:hypothetical protein